MPSSTDPKDLGFPPEATLWEIKICPTKPDTAKDSASGEALTAWSRKAATTRSRASALESAQRRRPAECRRRGAAPHAAESSTRCRHAGILRARMSLSGISPTHARGGGRSPRRRQVLPGFAWSCPVAAAWGGEEGRVGAGWRQG
jgi:hypothetical protein